MGRKQKTKRRSAPRHGLRAKVFEVDIIQGAMTATFEDVAEKQRFPATTIRKIFRRAAHKLKTDPKWRYTLQGPVIGIDDAHPKRREEQGDRKTCTVFTDMVPGYPIAEVIGETNSSGVVKAFDLIPGSESVDTIITDGSLAYKKAIKALRKRRRKILHIIDKFHVIRKVGFALEDTVKTAADDEQNEETRELLMYFKTRLKKRPNDLIDAHDQMLHCIAKINAEVNSARELYLLIHKFYNCEYLEDAIRIKEAKKVLKEFKKEHGDASHHVKNNFVKAARYINNYTQEILNFFLLGVTNGPAETNNRRFKKVQSFSTGCSFEVVAVRVMYDSGVWKDDNAIEGVAEGLPMPRTAP